jgi:hypothetical protein
MNPRPTDPPPLPPVFRPADAEGAGARRALAGFVASLRTERDGLEAPDFEELARAVDGDLDLGERELWQERVAADPELGRRAAELAQFRAAIGESGSVVPFGRPPGRVSLSGWLAAAAVLLFVVAIREVPELVSKYGSLRAAAPRVFDLRDEPVFADGFEGGDASSWSTSSPAG